MAVWTSSRTVVIDQVLGFDGGWMRFAGKSLYGLHEIAVHVQMWDQIRDCTAWMPAHHDDDVALLEVEMRAAAALCEAGWPAAVRIGRPRR